MKRKFLPGSEWLYFKIYMSRSFVEKMLTKDLSNILNGMLKNGYINSFFFIRYSDPHYHIRLRCHVNDLNTYGYILNSFNTVFSKLMDQDIIWNVEIGTYERELERYHKLLIEDTESLFYLDSLYCIKLMNVVKHQDMEDYKWKICFINTISYLDLFFEDDIQAKLNLIQDMSNSFKLEFGFNENNAKNFNQLYRDQQSTIEDLLNLNQSQDVVLKKVAGVVRKRDSSLRAVANNLKDTCKNKGVDVNQKISSYIHMSINRMIPSMGRIHELIIYDNLARMYSSIIARKKHRANNLRVTS